MRTHVRPYQVSSIARILTQATHRPLSPARSEDVPAHKKRTGSACPIGAPRRREGGWNVRRFQREH